MKIKYFIFSILLIITAACEGPSNFAKKADLQIDKNDLQSVIVFADLNSDKIFYSSKTEAEKRYAPCSTFKIYNALIGAELGLIKSATQDFYTWDKKIRFYAPWNQDLNFKKAFAYSCVPAFQNLARAIGKKRMQVWLKKIAYGSQIIQSKIDQFWLPFKGTQPILISPKEQALLLKKLLHKKLPFKHKSFSIVKEAMFIVKTHKGSLYGKTGSSGNGIGWFVGFVNSKNKSYSFAYLLKGKKASGSFAKSKLIALLKKNKLL